ncbi:MAG: DUF2892 domain-containing protein [Gemmobacter sp.]|jgi:hypothetical protein|nr:DUF2892 domain-containing protein [Gemmobacter sp.]
MTLERVILRIAGVMVVLSAVLTLWVSPYFVWFTAFIGLNLLLTSYTGFCPAISVLRRLGLRSGAASE